MEKEDQLLQFFLQSRGEISVVAKNGFVDRRRIKIGLTLIHERDSVGPFYFNSRPVRP